MQKNNQYQETCYHELSYIFQQLTLIFTPIPLKPKSNLHLWECQQLHIATFLRSELSFASTISMCNEAPMLCHHATSKECFTHTQCGKKKKNRGKKRNRANAQGKYNTISTSTVARRSWSQQNTKNTLPCFCAHRNPFMQVK